MDIHTGSVLEENLKAQFDLAVELIDHYVNHENPGMAIRGRELELALGDTTRGANIPRRVFHLMKNMRAGA